MYPRRPTVLMEYSAVCGGGRLQFVYHLEDPCGAVGFTDSVRKLLVISGMALLKACSVGRRQGSKAKFLPIAGDSARLGLEPLEDWLATWSTSV